MMCGAAGAGPFSFAVALRRACRTGDFVTTAWVETGSNSLIFGGTSSVAYIGSRSYHIVYQMNNGWMVDGTYNGSCPFFEMVISQGEVRTISGDEADFGMTGSQVTFPPLPKISDLVIHCHVTRENVSLLLSLSKRM